MRKTFFVSILLASALLLVSRGRAEDASSLITQADAAYAKRDDVPQVKIAMVLYEQAAAQDASRAVECHWKASRSAWWAGKHAQGRRDQLDYFQKGIDFAKAAVALNPESVEAHFWMGVNYGSFGESKGVLKSLALVKPIRHEMAEVIRINDKYLGGGAYRVLGVVDYKVPGLMGGSKKRAKEQLEKALAMGPNDPFSHYYLAEFYSLTNEKAKAQAEKDILEKLDVSPDLKPEHRMLVEMAKEL